MSIVLILHFTAHDLEIKEYTAIDINRRENELHINVTNILENLAFNGVFEKIQDYLGDDESFAITIKQGEGQATFADMAVDYYLNAGGEVLHFGKRQAQTEKI